MKSSINAVWIGDESKCPWESLSSWGSITVFDNDTLQSRKWKLKEQMRYYARTGEINGVADCMRWELIYDLGGIFVDADSELIRELPAFIQELPAAAAWENEIARPGLIACGFLKFPPKDVFVEKIIETILETPHQGKQAWETVGPNAITEAFKKYKPSHLTILPSHFFYPKHFSGIEYTGTYILAKQNWSSTRNTY